MPKHADRRDRMQHSWCWLLSALQQPKQFLGACKHWLRWPELCCRLVSAEQGPVQMFSHPLQLMEGWTCDDFILKHERLKDIWLSYRSHVANIGNEMHCQLSEEKMQLRTSALQMLRSKKCWLVQHVGGLKRCFKKLLTSGFSLTLTLVSFGYALLFI